MSAGETQAQLLRRITRDVDGLAPQESVNMNVSDVLRLLSFANQSRWNM